MIPQEKIEQADKILYVAGFMFSPDFENVILIEKKKPEWQKGKYNGIGGKIEQGETPIDAMVREFEEEAGIKTTPSDWKSLCIIGTDEYSVSFFYCTHKDWEEALSMTDEEVFNVPIMDLHAISYGLIENLNWLIPMCIDKGTNFSGEIVTDTAGVRFAEAEMKQTTTFEIDFCGHVKAKIEVTETGLTIVAAMNGYGDALDPDQITITQIEQ